MIERRILKATSIVGVAGVTFALAACSASSDADEDHVTMAHYPNNMITISYDIAEREGFFADEDITVDTIDVAKGPEAVAGLMSGSTDIAWATPATFIPAVEEGQEIIAVPPFMDLDYGIYVPEDSDIRSVEDLKGKRIGVNAIGGAVQTFAEQVLDAKGMTAADVQFIASGASLSQIPALENDQLDATSAAYGSMVTVRDAGLPVRSIASALDGTGGAYSDTGLASFWSTSAQLLESSPEKVEKFCRAVTKASAWLADDANREAAITLIEEVTNVTEGTAADLWDKERAFYNPSIDEQRWDQNVEMVTGETEASRSFDESVYDCS